MEAQGATMEPKGNPKCQRDTTRLCKVPQRHQKHVQTARGRVLAEGDVDIYHVYVYIVAFVVVHIMGSASAADLLPGPKPSESFFVPAHVEAQRVKTRGPNPNPTTQAQSKRCLPLFTKTQKLIKILPAGLPNPMLFWYLF